MILFLEIKETNKRKHWFLLNRKVINWFRNKFYSRELNDKLLLIKRVRVSSSDVKKKNRFSENEF
jgi:hypothetical protein